MVEELVRRLARHHEQTGTLDEPGLLAASKQDAVITFDEHQARSRRQMVTITNVLGHDQAPGSVDGNFAWHSATVPCQDLGCWWVLALLDVLRDPGDDARTVDRRDDLLRAGLPPSSGVSTGASIHRPSRARSSR